MKFLTTFVLILGALASLYISIKALIGPETVLANFGISVNDANGRNEIRGQYGGFFAAIAITLILALANKVSKLFALRVLLVTIGGVLFGRLLSIVIEGVSVVEAYSASLNAFILFDLLMVGLILVCLKAYDLGGQS